MALTFAKGSSATALRQSRDHEKHRRTPLGLSPRACVCGVVHWTWPSNESTKYRRCWQNTGQAKVRDDAPRWEREGQKMTNGLHRNPEGVVPWYRWDTFDVPSCPARGAMAWRCAPLSAGKSHATDFGHVVVLATHAVAPDAASDEENNEKSRGNRRRMARRSSTRESSSQIDGTL